MCQFMLVGTHLTHLELLRGFSNVVALMVAALFPVATGMYATGSFLFFRES